MNDLAPFEFWDIKYKVKSVETARRIALKPYATLKDKLTNDVLDGLTRETLNEMIQEMAGTLDWFEQNWASPIARGKKSEIWRKSKGIKENSEFDDE